MNLDNYRDTFSWQAAIDLGRPLTMLLEDLPSQEERGLIMALQSLMIELPAAIANDLLTGSSDRLPVMLRLQAALELIDRVYPALDPSRPRTDLESLMKRTQGDTFTELRTPPMTSLENDSDEAPEPAPTPTPMSIPAPVAVAAPLPVAAPQPALEPVQTGTTLPAPTTITVVPEPAPVPDVEEPPARLDVPITPPTDVDTSGTEVVLTQAEPPRA